MTAPYIFTDPRARPLNANGDIMPGCYMQFYESVTPPYVTLWALMRKAV